MKGRKEGRKKGRKEGRRKEAHGVARTNEYHACVQCSVVQCSAVYGGIE